MASIQGVPPARGTPTPEQQCAAAAATESQRMVADSRRRRMSGIDDFDPSSLKSVQTRSHVPDLKAERKAYIESLPEGLTLLNSARGATMLASCSAQCPSSPSQHQWLGPLWRVQVGLKRCGVASTTIVLNSLRPSQPVLEEQQLLTPESGSTLSEEALLEVAATVDTQGLCLGDLQRLCQSFNVLLPVRAVHAEESSIEDCRLQIIEALCEPNQRVLLNYHMSTIGQVSDRQI